MQMSATQNVSEEESFFSSVKISVTQFIDLYPQYSETHMFELKEMSTTKEFLDLSTVSDFSSLIQSCSDDTLFGKIYAILGKFRFNDKNGFVVVLHRDIVTNLEFTIRSSLQLIQFVEKNCINKINRRLRQKHTFISCEIRGSLILDLYLSNILIIPANTGNLGQDTILSIWNRVFSPSSLILPGTDSSKLLKRKHSILMPQNAATILKESTDSHKIPRKIPQKKKLESIFREAKVSESNIEERPSHKSKINLREEAVSLIEGAFEKRWSPENFVKGFLSLKNKSLMARERLASICTSMLMDASYRITDCTPIGNSRVINKVGIDIDQVNFIFLCK